MLMAALSTNARAVIEEAREEMRAPAGERERLEALLAAHLVPTAPTPVAQSLSPVRHASSWRLVTSLTVGVALVGGAALWTLRPNATPKSPPPAASTPAEVKLPEPATVQTAPAIVVQSSSTVEPIRSAKPAIEAQAPVQRAQQDRLAQEVALLSRATSDLRAGRAGAALKLLDEHQRKFPNGMLTVERRAVRAQALCSLKRVSEGRAELSQLAPQSPAAGRAKQLCDAASATQH